MGRGAVNNVTVETVNGIIGDNHHGSRSGHGTHTATAHIDRLIAQNYDLNYITTILQTDLSAAFDTVDSDILTQKLDYYGLDKNTLKLLNSFLTDRRQYLSINSFNSDIIDCPPCSVIQGSKLSSLLYTIYTNEIPQLYKLMDMTNFRLITDSDLTNDFENMTHETINYVDDSTNIVTTNDSTTIQDYINDYYRLLETYYDTNKLKINADKSRILIICRPGHRQLTYKIQLTASNYTILQSDTIKMLGIHYTKTFDNTKNFNTITSKVSYRLNTIKSILGMAPIKTKTILSTSLLISIIRYGAGRMTNLSDNQISKINSLMLKISRYILGIKSYRMSTSNIFKELGWLSYPQIITSEAIKIIYNINNKCKPRSMMKFFQFDNVLYGEKRLVRTPFLKHKPN